MGDLHGRLDLFEQMLERIEQDVMERGRCSTRIVLLGDVIDRGPDSKALVERVRRLERGSERFIVLLGNHEELLLASARGLAPAQRYWLRYGGAATLRSYGLDPVELLDCSPSLMSARITEALGQDVIDWIASLPLTYRSGDYFFCHAGVRPGVSLAQQQRDDLLHIRTDFLKSRRYHGAVVVHGHSEVVDISVASNRINLDTAAYRTGRLSALGVQGRSYWTLGLN